MTDRPKQHASASNTGFDENQDYIGDTLGKLVPQWLARRAIDVSVTTDKRTYDIDEPVIITIEFRNRLPIPIPVETETIRIWGWAVDDLVEASNERTYLPDKTNRIDFRPFEEKTFTRTWSGRFKRTGHRIQWESADPGTHEITGFIAAAGKRVSDTTTIQIK